MILVFIICQDLSTCLKTEDIYFVIGLGWISIAILRLLYNLCISLLIYEPRREKTGLRGFRPGPTQTRLYNHTRWLEA